MDPSPIAVDPAICAGKPHMRGTRLTVEFLRGLETIGWTRESILGVYPYLRPEELDAALAYTSSPPSPSPSPLFSVGEK